MPSTPSTGSWESDLQSRLPVCYSCAVFIYCIDMHNQSIQYSIVKLLDLIILARNYSHHINISTWDSNTTGSQSSVVGRWPCSQDVRHSVTSVIERCMLRGYQFFAGGQWQKCMYASTHIGSNMDTCIHIYIMSTSPT